MMKRPDEEFVSREEAATELERLAASIRKGDPEARVFFSVQLTFRHIRKLPETATSR